MHVPALQRSLPDLVAEYDEKLAAIGDQIRTFERAGNTLKMAATISGTYGDVSIDVGHVHESSLKTMLLKSAWKHVYDGCSIDRIASADDRRKWKQSLENPVPFTLDNIRATLGHYLLDPRGNILRGLAEVFCQLDQAYKSHDKVKIGVAGLPKRVVLRNVGYSSSYGREKLRDMLNALAAYRGEPLTEYAEFNELDALHSSFSPKAGEVTIRGLRIKKFLNNNAHVFFDKKSLRDINKALAEFYGDVLPDTTGDKPVKKQASTAVAKDLQYYPTPAKVASDILRHHVADLTGKNTLDPSCGCGRLLDAMRKQGACANGIEIDASRVAQARAKGHPVLMANFLETVPTAVYDLIFLNPPFYGKHYAKHVEHALKFVKPGGQLIAILPVTARYDHGLLDHLLPKSSWSTPWHDLPVGSFSESGTNINTTVLSITKPKG